MRPQTPSAFIIWLWRAAFLGAAAAGAALPGCNNSSAPDAGAAKVAAPLASIKTAAAEPTDSQQQSEPPAGSPEALLHEAKLLRIKPFDHLTSPDKIAEARRLRLKELVRMATEVLAKTHDDPSKERTFDDGAYLLMNTRLQLALCDDPQLRDENVDALYEHAAAFYERDPQSRAAAEAAYTVAKLAHENAREHRTSDWINEFATQAQLFATKFPREQSRAGSLLFSAGWSCELHGLTKPAIDCYRLLVDLFPDAEDAVTAAGSIRRLELIGKPVQLGGSTLDGGYVSIDEFAGKPVFVLFWKSGNAEVSELISELRDLQSSAGREISVIGVALDEDPADIEAFLGEQALDWKHIFFADPAKRGWKNTVAEFYGVKGIPSLWLIGPDGRVVSTNVTAETARKAIAGL